MGKCALIVDDSKTSRVVLSRILETHELAVDTAVSAEDAFDYLHGNRIRKRIWPPSAPY